MAFKCAIPRRATILRESGRRTFNHSTGGKSQPCHSRGGNTRARTNYCARYKPKHLRWHEFEEVILDVKTILNNRPLGYVEDYIQMSILTPNLMLFEQLNQIPEEEPAKGEDYDLRKCAKYQRKCKDVLCKRWTTEYLKALRERHNLNHQTKEATLKEGDVYLIKGEERNRSKWKLVWWNA